MFSQRAYVQRILKTFHTETRNGSRTTEATSESTMAVPGVAPGEFLPYRKMLGEHPADFDHTHMHMTKNHAIVFEGAENMNVQCHTDADFANDKDDRKSTSGYLQWKHLTPELIGEDMGSFNLAAKPGKHRNNKHIDN
ncbi:hypothetical protein PybrP1_010449 [[Pythium] brassicae (nom. inval.)]|nr:hypothetical protein PybrP1_010449 [[Pythium] brassicae (nom. inval.)]